MPIGILITKIDRSIYNFQRIYERKLARNRGNEPDPIISQANFAAARNARPRLTAILCWIIGHTDDGCCVEDSFKKESGGIIPGWMYYCARCNTADPYPDKRDLYFRFRVWLLLKYRVPFLN